MNAAELALLQQRMDARYAAREAEETAEQVTFAERAHEALASIAAALDQIDGRPEKDRRKHGDECWTKHVDCLADHISGLIGGLA